MSKEHADWTLSPALESRAKASAKAEPYKKRSRRLFLLSIFALVGSCGFGLSELDLAVEVSLALAFYTFLAGIYFMRLGGKRELLLQQRDRELLVEYSSVRGWLVDLFVLQGNTPTGRDRGVLWFEEDRLYFVGDRTSFGVSRGQIAAMQADGFRVSDLRPEFVLELSVDTPLGKTGFGFDQILSIGSNLSNSSSNDLAQVLRGWMRSTGNEEGQLPPFALGPGIPSLNLLFLRAVGNTIVWATLIITMAAAGFWLGWGAALVSIAIGVFPLTTWSDLWFPRLRWQAWRDRKRLDDASHNRSQ